MATRNEQIPPFALKKLIFFHFLVNRSFILFDSFAQLKSGGSSSGSSSFRYNKARDILYLSTIESGSERCLLQKCRRRRKMERAIRIPGYSRLYRQLTGRPLAGIADHHRKHELTVSSGRNPANLHAPLFGSQDGGILWIYLQSPDLPQYACRRV